MKKVMFSVVLALCLLITPFAAFADAEPTEITDETANVTFTVPSGWSRVSAAETDSIKYAFQKDGDDKQQFLGYSVVDIYEGSDESLKSSYSRSEIDNSIMTAKEFEEKMIGSAADSGITDPKVGSVTVGKYDFFKLTFKQKVSEESTVNVVLYAHIVNGYSVYFRFQTYNGEPDAADIDAVITSVNFADEKEKSETKPSEEAESETKADDNTKKKSASSRTAKGGIVGGGTAFILAVLGLILRKLRKR